MNIKLYVSILLISMIVFQSAAQVETDSVFNTLIRSENGGWVAGDATYSIHLPDDRTLWLFGDSFIGTALPDSSLAPGAHMIRNCAIIQEGDSMTAIYQGTFEEPEDFVLTPTPDSTWFWPEHGIVEDDTLRIIFAEFGTNDGPPGWNFEYRHSWMVNFTFPELEMVRMYLIPFHTENGVIYGDRLLNHEGNTYIYGRKVHNPDDHIPYPYLARCPIGELSDDWEFYDGDSWVSDPSASTQISSHPVSQQFGVLYHQGKFVMITQQIWLGGIIYSLTSDHPEGPWENVTELYTTPYPFEDTFTYNAYSHPQFDENNELLISYNTNGDFWSIFNNVELYRPNFIRVPYEMIDSTFTPVIIENFSENSSQIHCYPIPTGNQIFVSIDSKEVRIVNLHIYDSYGRLVIKENDKRLIIGNNIIQIDVTRLQKGVFILKVDDFSGKLIRN